MTNNELMRPAIAAIMLAFLYPLYFFLEIVVEGTTLSSIDYVNVDGLGFTDLLFVIVGALAIYVLLAFRRTLIEHHNYRSIDIPLLMFVAINLIYYVSLFVIDASLIFFGDGFSNSINELLVGSMVVIFFSSLPIYGIFEILIGVLLLRDSNQLPNTVRVFAIVLLILGISDLSVILGFMAIFIYPIVYILLAVHFLSKPEMIEVV